MKHWRFLLLLPLVAACSGEPKPPVVATDVIVMETMPGMKMTAGYMTLRNNTNRDIVVTHVTSPQFDAVELHETIVEDDIAKMREISELQVPANGHVTLQRGGKHMMLMRPTGEDDAVTLQVWSGDTMLLSVETGYTGR